MAHPHRSEALSSSRTKMRAMTGAGGGGSPFLGSSPFKRSGSDGELKSYHSHEKQFQPHAAGGKSKKRADRFARGGHVWDANAKITGKEPARPSSSKPSEYDDSEGAHIRSQKRGGHVKRARGGKIDPRAYEIQQDREAGAKNPRMADGGHAGKPIDVDQSEGKKIYEQLSRGSKGTPSWMSHREAEDETGGMGLYKRGGSKRLKRAEGGHTPGSSARLHQRIDAERAMPGMGRAIGAQDAASGRGEGWLHGEGIHGSEVSGEGGEYKRGGRKAGGGPVDDEPAGYGQGQTAWAEKYRPVKRPGKPAAAGVQSGPRSHEYAEGGRTNPFRQTGGHAGKRKAGNVSVNIMIPQAHHRPPMPPVPGQAGAADVMGGAPGAGPPAPAPVNPLAGMAGAGGAGMPGGMPGAGGANPQALQALSQIASGAGGIGGGAGRGPFKRGGVAKSTGLASNLKHWQGYAKKNVEQNTAHEHGATGESRELPMKTPEEERGGRSDWKVAQKRGDRGAIKRASGGRTPKIPVDIKGGADTGVGRKRMAKIQPSWR